jgi:hypothetical protein
VNAQYDPRYSTTVLDGPAITALTAAGSGDATAVNGPWVLATDYHSCCFGCKYNATIASTKTLTIAGIVQTASDSSGTGAATLATLTSVVIPALATPGAASGAFLFANSVDLSTTANLGYIRLQFTPDLNASGTDTASVGGFILTGPHRTVRPNP